MIHERKENPIIEIQLTAIISDKLVKTITINKTHFKINSPAGWIIVPDLTLSYFI